MKTHRSLHSIETRTRVMAAWISKTHHLISLFLLVFFFFPLFWISQYNYPSGDDYPNFFHAQSLGTLGAIKWSYLNWTGRYTSFLLQSLFPEYDTWLVAYTIVPIALFLAGFGCLFFFVRAFFGPRFSTQELFTLSSVSYIILVGLTPDIATGFYWMPTNVQYLGAVFITLLLLALYITVEAATQPLARGTLSVIAVILIAFLAGLNEISIVLFIAIVGSISVFQFIKFKKVSTPGLTFLAFGILFALLSFFAPGNSLRASQTAGNPHVIQTLVNAIGLTLYLFLELLSLPTLLLTSGLYLVFLDVNRERLGHLFSSLSEVHWYWILAFLFCTFTVINAGLFTAVGLRGVTDRVTNVSIYSLMFGWFFFLTVLFVNVTARESLRFSIPKWGIGLLTASVVVFLATGFGLQFIPGNFAPSATRSQKIFSAIRTKSIYANAYLDILSGRAALYASQNQETTIRFRAAQGGCVEFLPLSYAPETIFIDFVKYPWTWCPMEYARWLDGRRSP